MPNLIGYGIRYLQKNALAGYLVKAQCCICGRKYGSIEEAKDCENKHIKDIIRQGK